MCGYDQQDLGGRRIFYWFRFLGQVKYFFAPKWACEYLHGNAEIINRKASASTAAEQKISKEAWLGGKNKISSEETHWILVASSILFFKSTVTKDANINLERALKAGHQKEGILSSLEKNKMKMKPGYLFPFVTQQESLMENKPTNTLLERTKGAAGEWVSPSPSLSAGWFHEVSNHVWQICPCLQMTKL